MYFFFCLVSDLEHAATKIQACFRGHAERKNIPKKENDGDGDGDGTDKKEDIDIDEITKKVK